MLVVWTIEYPANPVGQLIRSEKPVSLDHLALGVNPFRLYSIQPRTSLRKQAAHDPHATAVLFDPAVVRTEPPSDLFGYMPARVVPDEQKGFLAKGFEPLKAPLKESRRYGRNRPPVHEPDPRFIDPWQIESVAAYGLRLGVVLGDRLLDEARGFALLAPGVLKVGRASRLHQHSSSKPTAHSGSEAEISISRSLAKLAFFSFVQGVGGGDPPLGPHPANPEYSRKRGSDGLPAHVLLGQPLLEGDIGG